MIVNTAISHVNKQHEIILGYDLTKLIAEKPFVDVVYLLLRGTWPSTEQAALFNAVLVAAIDHGAAPGSSIAARVVSSAGNDPHVALAAGLLAQGTLHGGAIEASARMLLTNVAKDAGEVVADYKQEGKRLPGFGHKLLLKDRRSAALFERAKALGLYGPHAACAEQLEVALNAGAAKPLPLNVDGAMAAVLLDMGFSPEPMRGIFALARLPGLLAQIVEEQATFRGPRRLSDEEVVYTGPESAV